MAPPHSDDASGPRVRREASLADCRRRLRWMVRLRLDPRLRERVDESDVLQEAMTEIARRMPEYQDGVEVPFYVWARTIAGQKLIDLHRRHFAERRDVRREARPAAAAPEISTLELSSILVENRGSPLTNVQRAELAEQVRAALDGLDGVDREVLTLRHLEQLSNAEAARVLGLSESAASRSFLRAARRLRDALGGALDTQ